MILMSCGVGNRQCGDGLILFGKSGTFGHGWKGKSGAVKRT